MCPILVTSIDCSLLLCPWDSPSKSTEVCCHFLLQEIFLTQESNMDLPHCRHILYRLSYEGSPCFIYQTPKAFDCVDHNKLWKALKEMVISVHLTCLLRNLCVAKKQHVAAYVEQLIGSRLRKKYDRAVCCHPVCLIYMLRTS